MQADVPVVVDFWAHWCGPCKLIDPVMKTLEADSNGQVKVVKVEVDSNEQLVEQYGVCYPECSSKRRTISQNTRSNK